VIEREEQHKIEAAEIMVPLVPLIDAVVVFQILRKGRGNVTPHDTQ
jgi:hypothetical protein